MSGENQTPNFAWQKAAIEDQNWGETDQALNDSIDKDVYAVLDRGETILTGGGTITYLSGVFTWTAPFDFVQLTTGKYARIPAGSITLNDGDIAYVNIPRPMVDNITALSIQVASALGIGQQVQFFMMRRGTTIYMVNGGAFKQVG